MKVIVGAFNKKKALVAPPNIVKTFAKFRCKLYYTNPEVALVL